MAEYNSESFSFINLDAERYKKTLDRTMGQVIREAAREWLRTILKNGVPVETGMAKATLIPLGRFLKNVGGLSVRPTRKPYFSQLYGETQEIDAGIDRGHDFEIRDDKSHPMSFIYGFYWSTAVIHYWTAAYYNGAATPGPEQIEEADRALWAHIDYKMQTREGLPAVRDFLIRGNHRWSSRGYDTPDDEEF